MYHDCNYYDYLYWVAGRRAMLQICFVLFVIGVCFRLFMFWPLLYVLRIIMHFSADDQGVHAVGDLVLAVPVEGLQVDVAIRLHKRVSLLLSLSLLLLLVVVVVLSLLLCLLLSSLLSSILLLSLL